MATQAGTDGDGGDTWGVEVFTHLWVGVNCPHLTAGTDSEMFGGGGLPDRTNHLRQEQQSGSETCRWIVSIISRDTEGPGQQVVQAAWLTTTQQEPILRAGRASSSPDSSGHCFKVSLFVCIFTFYFQNVRWGEKNIYLKCVFYPKLSLKQTFFKA